MTTRYIYPTHPARNGRLVIPIGATGHIEVDGRIVCGVAAPEPCQARDSALAGRPICADCKATYYPAPVRVSARERQRAVEAEMWERLTGVRPAVK